MMDLDSNFSVSGDHVHEKFVGINNLLLASSLRSPRTVSISSIREKTDVSVVPQTSAISSNTVTDGENCISRPKISYLSNDVATIKRVCKEGWMKYWLICMRREGFGPKCTRTAQMWDTTVRRHFPELPFGTPSSIVASNRININHIKKKNECMVSVGFRIVVVDVGGAFGYHLANTESYQTYSTGRRNKGAKKSVVYNSFNENPGKIQTVAMSMNVSKCAAHLEVPRLAAESDAVVQISDSSVDCDKDVLPAPICNSMSRCDDVKLGMGSTSETELVLFVKDLTQKIPESFADCTKHLLVVEQKFIEHTKLVLECKELEVMTNKMIIQFVDGFTTMQVGDGVVALDFEKLIAQRQLLKSKLEYKDKLFEECRNYDTVSLFQTASVNLMSRLWSGKYSDADRDAVMHSIIYMLSYHHQFQ
jgi:hypothetical protein